MKGNKEEKKRRVGKTEEERKWKCVKVWNQNQNKQKKKKEKEKTEFLYRWRKRYRNTSKQQRSTKGETTTCWLDGDSVVVSGKCCRLENELRKKVSGRNNGLLQCVSEALWSLAPKKYLTSSVVFERLLKKPSAAVQIKLIKVMKVGFLRLLPQRNRQSRCYFNYKQRERKTTNVQRKSLHPLWKVPVLVLLEQTQAHLARPVKTLKWENSAGKSFLAHRCPRNLFFL